MITQWQLVGRVAVQTSLFLVMQHFGLLSRLCLGEGEESEKAGEVAWAFQMLSNS